MGPNTKSHQNSAVSVENFQFPIKHTKWLGFLYTNHVALLQLSLAFPLTLLLSKKYIYTVKSQAVACFGYSRVWNKRSPLNKHSPLENLAKRINVAPFFTLCFGVRNKAVAPG